MNDYPAGRVRIGALGGFREFVYELGGNPSAILEQLGIDERRWSEPNSYISAYQHRMALIKAAEQTQTPRFGLLLAQRQSLRKFGAIGYLAKHAGTVGESLMYLIRYLDDHDTETQARLDIEDDLAMITIKMASLRGETIIQQNETSIGLCLRVMRALLDESWRPTSIYFEHEKPADATLYSRIFRCPVYFGQTLTGIEFPAGDLRRKSIYADPQLFNILKEHVESTHRQRFDQLIDRVRFQIIEGLESGCVGLDDISHALDMNRNKLQRLLKAQGTSYQEVLEQTRFNLAQTYLLDTNLPLSVITTMLAYAEPAVFTRAFKRMAGVPPSRWREEHMRLG